MTDFLVSGKDKRSRKEGRGRRRGREGGRRGKRREGETPQINYTNMLEKERTLGIKYPFFPFSVSQKCDQNLLVCFEISYSTGF